MKKVAMSSDEVSAIHTLLGEMRGRYTTVDDEEFLNMASIYAQELPRRLRSAMNHVRLAELPVVIISGFPIVEEKIGLTPKSWPKDHERQATLDEEMLLVLLGSLLGDAIGWSTQQDGRIVHDVFPIMSHAHEQIGTGSEQPIWWHTEDAFHDARGDYVGLMCLRNPDLVATTVCPMDSIVPQPDEIRLLSQAKFTIRVDMSHQRKAMPEREGQVANGDFEKLEQAAPWKVAVLSGPADAPYIRIDPYFMDPAEDPEAQRAVNELIRKIDERIQEVVLMPGDVCFIDNYRAVHGRKPFKASYTGKDRWLKRINITRDLRKSRTYRKSSTSRIIFAL